MVVGDYFSKWKEANALFDYTAQTATDILAIEFVSRLCVSIRIHIDQGREFGLELFSQVCTLLRFREHS